jgi:hypothetical protein
MKQLFAKLTTQQQRVSTFQSLGAINAPLMLAEL